MISPKDQHTRRFNYERIQFKLDIFFRIHSCYNYPSLVALGVSNDGTFVDLLTGLDIKCCVRSHLVPVIPRCNGNWPTFINHGTYQAISGENEKIIRSCLPISEELSDWVTLYKTGELFLTNCFSNQREILLTCVPPERSVFTTGRSDLILQPSVHTQLYTSD